MRKLFTCLFGSGLYGTRTPTSDLDVKHVCLPDLDDLLLGKKVTNKVKKTNTAHNTKNSVDDVDEEFIPLQVFAKDFMMGQTYALELAFAVECTGAEQTFYDQAENKYSPQDVAAHFNDNLVYIPFIEFTQELREKFLTSNIKAMMGYVVNQASLYSFKGERLNVSREFKDILEGLACHPSNMNSTTLGYAFAQENHQSRFAQKIHELAHKYPKYFKITEYDIGGERMRPCFTLLEKTFPFTNLIDHSVMVTDTLINKYGSRAAAASETNVDWKATMHALRIVDEGLQLLGDHTLTFPFEPDYAQRLLSIKRGEVPLAEVTEELTMKLDRLKDLEKETTLPAYDQQMQEQFDSWLAGWMRYYYNICIID